MADIASALSGGWGVAFLVAAGVMLEAIAAVCSSPQTAEINADKRAATLMKWVYIGVGLGVLLTLIAAKVDRTHRQPILFGGLVAGAIMLGLYQYAKTYGLRNGGPSTES